MFKKRTTVSLPPMVYDLIIIGGGDDPPSEGNGLVRTEAARGARREGAGGQGRRVPGPGPPRVQRQAGSCRRWRGQCPRDRPRDFRGGEEGDPRPPPRGVPGHGEERGGRDEEPD